MDRWFDTEAIQNAVPGRFGNSGKGIIQGSGVNNWDINFAKNFLITERHRVQFRAELFNAFNHAPFDDPVMQPVSAQCRRTGSESQCGQGAAGERLRVPSNRARRSVRIEVHLLSALPFTSGEKKVSLPESRNWPFSTVRRLGAAGLLWKCPLV
jgi:hypothetical protein